MVMFKEPLKTIIGHIDDYPEKLTLVCPKDLGERIRSIIMELGLFDPDRSIGTDDSIHFPILVGSSKEMTSLIQRIEDFGEEVELMGSNGSTKRRAVHKNPYERVIEKLRDELDDGSLRLVPRNYELIGDCCILKVPGELSDHFGIIGQVFKEVLRSRFVLNDTRGIHGELREPDMEVILPPENGEYEVVHKEGSARYVLDPRRIMFSSGNIDERMFFPSRIADLPRPPRLVVGDNGSHIREIVVDMFAGIGYFTIPLALDSDDGLSIFAVELNPISYTYLKRNISLNKVEKKITPVLGDNRNVLPDGIADRILMGFVGGTIEYLPKAFDLLKPEGGFIHLHDTIETEIGIEGLFLNIGEILPGDKRAELIYSRKIKSYAPRIDHVVLDIKVTPVG